MRERQREKDREREREKEREQREQRERERSVFNEVVIYYLCFKDKLHKIDVFHNQITYFTIVLTMVLIAHLVNHNRINFYFVRIVVTTF